MKEKLEIAEKSLLLLIPYLIVLSLSYYWGYWGHFNLDAVSYYGVQDLIKGFAYALPVVVMIGCAMLVFNLVVDLFANTLRKRLNRFLYPIIFGIPFIIFFALYIIGKLPEATSDWVGPVVIAVFILSVLDVLGSAIGKTWGWAIENGVPFFFMKWLGIFCIISFISSFAYGMNEAQSISRNKRFSYSQLPSTSDSTRTRSIFKYLGKAGDYYFFVSPDNKERRIITVQTIPNLVLYEYDKDSPVSVQAYRTLMAHGKGKQKQVLVPRPASQDTIRHSQHSHYRHTNHTSAAQPR